MKTNGLIIVPFILPWDWSADYQRQTCFQLAKTNQVIAYMSNEAVFFLKDLFFRRKKYKSCKNIFFYRPVYFVPFRRFEFVEKLNQLICLLVIIWRFGRYKKQLFWIFNPEFYFWPKYLSSVFSVYDCVDYHSSVDEVEKKKIRYQEKLLIKNTSRIFVNSYSLKKIHSKLRRDIMVVPQGFRLKEFRHPAKTKKVFRVNAPLIGMVGSINYRLDFKLLIELVVSNPKWNFVFWGPIYQDPQDKYQSTSEFLQKLLNQKNVFWGKSRSTKEIPGIIDQLDICIIPYDISQNFNKYCYPMKLFEYFYMGKPVIATPINELKLFPKFVKIGKTTNEWQKYIKTLRSKPWPKKYKYQQRELAINNSWEKKIEAISKTIKISKEN